MEIITYPTVSFHKMNETKYKAMSSHTLKQSYKQFIYQYMPAVLPAMLVVIKELCFP